MDEPIAQVDIELFETISKSDKARLGSNSVCPSCGISTGITLEAALVGTPTSRD